MIELRSLKRVERDEEKESSNEGEFGCESMCRKGVESSILPVSRGLG